MCSQVGCHHPASRRGVILCALCALFASMLAMPTPAFATPVSRAIDDDRSDDDQATTPRLKSLDELLGLVVIEGGPSTDAGPASVHPGLEEALADGKPLDRMRKVQSLLEQASDAIGREDYSLATQRLQERAVKMIDDLLADAEQQQQRQQSCSSGGSSSSSSQDQQSQGGQSAQDQMADKDGSQQAKSGEREDATRQGNPKAGDPDGDQLPDRMDGDASGAMEATGIEWGSLPPRIREVLRQGLRERMSTPYRAWTEAYFRRIAEESRP
ncbi:MAG: hypothetical protein O2819_00325 [Planctomycetota bacterium]|nr:hypothetical protein [Planctomycetota bacterium]MDA1105392.1 hypothetical protein [Planctomycetota bacterium]